MEIKVKVEDLRKQKIFVATPMYGGQCHGLYNKSILDLQAILTAHGIENRFSFLFNESLITRARNYLVDEFLYRAPQFTHFLFLDSDIHFDPKDVLTLLALSMPNEQGETRDIIGAPYPKKSINWGNVVKAIKKNASLNPGDLETVVGDYVFNPVVGTKQFQVTEPLEVMEIGTGYMMVRREVFPKFAEAYPQLKYKPDHVGQKHFDGSRYIHAYFDTVIDTPLDPVDLLAKKLEMPREELVKLFPLEMQVKLGVPPGASDRYLSEDYMFCQWARKIGFKIWLCPWMKTQHLGTYPFSGNMPKVAELTGEL